MQKWWKIYKNRIIKNSLRVAMRTRCLSWCRLPFPMINFESCLKFLVLLSTSIGPSYWSNRGCMSRGSTVMKKDCCEHKHEMMSSIVCNMTGQQRVTWTISVYLYLYNEHSQHNVTHNVSSNVEAKETDAVWIWVGQGRTRHHSHSIGYIRHEVR